MLAYPLAGKQRATRKLAHVNHVLARCGCFAIVLTCGLGSPALADGRISVYAGAALADNGATDTLGLVQPDVAIGYDLGPRASGPVRIRLDADDAFGTGTFSSYNELSLGASVRLTTPTYFGIGASYDYVTVAAHFGGPIPLENYPYSPPPTSKSSAGVSFFAGQKLISTRAYGLALEGSYRFVPSVGYVNPSGFSIGLRGSFL